MLKNNPNNKHEIDLFDLASILFKNKWKIILSIVIPIIIIYGYTSNQIKNFTASSIVKPITTHEENKYIVFNDANSFDKVFYNKDNFNYLGDDYEIVESSDLKYHMFFSITKELLYKSYLEILQEKSVISDAIRELNILDRDIYIDNKTYEEAISSLVSKIKINAPYRVKGHINPSLSYGKDNADIQVTFNDITKWKSILAYIDKEINLKVRNNLKYRVDELLKIENKKKQFQIKDISTRIENKLIDYDRQTKNRILYLKEQSELAKALGIAKSTLEEQTFGNQKTLLLNVKTDTPFYLRGFEAIDKEIELLNKRTNKKAFIPELLALEQKKRNIQQNKNLARIQKSFESSPINNSDTFKAGSIDITFTDVVYHNINIFIFVLPSLFCFMIVIFYIFIINSRISIKSYKGKKI